jgi:glyoxylase-like metal-dependent hydrolase (beta-lactamase superfamily II)
MKLGRFEIHAVTDGSFALDGGAMFGIVPKVIWQRVATADELNRVRLAANPLFVRTPDCNILIDTGLGSRWNEKQRDIYAISGEGTLLNNLKALEVNPNDINVVINTHLHWDHCGTNTIQQDGNPVPAFPRARYIIQRAELEHARLPHERDRASYFTINFEPVAEAGSFDLVDGDAEIEEGIEVIRVGGHNKDMQCVRIKSEGQTAFFFADLVPTTWHINPAWVMGYDLYPVDVLEQRKKLLQQASEENWLCVFEHDPVISFGRIRKSEGKFSVEPLSSY